MKRKIGKIALVVVLIMGLLAAYRLVTVKPRPDRAFLQSPKPLNMAHRGGAGLAPESTILAFRNALEVGADVLELDVRATKDGEIVVIHDETVDRTTDGAGAVRDFILEELKKLDAGYRFTPDNGQTYPYRGQGITIPTLREVFAEFPDQRINIEIKQFEPPIEGRLAVLIEEMGMADKVLAVSEDEATIRRFRGLASEVATAAAENEVREFVIYLRSKAIPFYAPKADAFQVPEYHGDLHLVTKDFVEAAHGKNIKVHVWTVNDEEDMRGLLALGVDGIITDYPDRLAKVMHSLR